MLKQTGTPTTRRHLVIAAVMASMFMIAIEATIVSTAMPQIAAQLGGLHLYSWVFSSFLLTQTATTVIFGKLSDIYGRKPVLLAGILLFVIGSIFCGFATSIPVMIVFRFLQGIGAGAIQPVGITVVGDLYAAHERGKVQGFLASIWAVSAVIGPLAGGLIVQHFSWAWIFWINVPVGILAAALFWLFLHEGVRRERKALDVLGAGLFTAAIALLMTGLSEIGTNDAQAGILFAGFAVLALLFVLQERRAADPMIAFGLWARRPLAASNGAALLSGMALMGLTTFLPMYVQGVMGRSALTAGFALTTMVIGWPIGATLAARNLSRFGLRPILVFGAVLMPVGAAAFLALTPESSPVLAGLGSILMGFGMGLLSTASIVLIQDIVTWAQRGSATASNVFARNLGSTLGAAALGAVLNLGLARSGIDAADIEDSLRRLLDHPEVTSATQIAMRDALQHSLHLTFWAIFVVALATVILALLVPAIAIKRPGVAGDAVPASGGHSTSAPRP